MDNKIDQDAAAIFDNHRIVERIITNTLGSWLLRRKRDDGTYGSEFWCRITAGNRTLSVVGDFNPIVFAYGANDPESLVHWMGQRSGATDSYVCEKASIGSGRQTAFTYETALARQHLREAIEDTDDPVEIASFKAGLDEDEVDGIAGIHAMAAAIVDEYGATDILESIPHLGRRPSDALVLGFHAVRRLHLLLTAPA